PGRLAGDLEGGRFHWTLDVQPFVDPRARGGGVQPSGPSLLQLDLQLRWGDAPSQQLHWRTLRLASPVSP
ncbi:MAG: hypothetical protein ABN502_15535, partial [Gammaproteobacteria bacterium]